MLLRILHMMVTFNLISSSLFPWIRAKKGKGSFNWRMLFDVEIGHNTRAMKFPYFHMQLWDKDILKWNDCIGEGILNMGAFYKKVFKKNVAINLYEKKQGAAKDRARKRRRSQKKMIPDKKLDVPEEEHYPATITKVYTFNFDFLIFLLFMTIRANLSFLYIYLLEIVLTYRPYFCCRLMKRRGK